ncbi:DinB family protein, partial [Latilactobacillus sakei]|uniref:DinB family protein n=1 Tax=Latilactobacillus sakei TaxID=1599 RepID=UPI0011577F58
MPQYHSQQLIGFLSEQTEQYLHIAISRWQMIASQQFSYKPAPDKWSAAQCLLHLNSYGEYYLPAIEKAIETAGRHSTKAAIFHSGWLGNYFTEMMLPGEDG